MIPESARFKVTRAIRAKALERALNSEPRALKLTPGQIEYMRRRRDP